MNFCVAMLPFPVNLGESYSVRIHLSMDFARQINRLRQKAFAHAVGRAANPTDNHISFGCLAIQMPTRPILLKPSKNSLNKALCAFRDIAIEATDVIPHAHRPPHRAHRRRHATEMNGKRPGMS
jgi:hypothetical protein